MEESKSAVRERNEARWCMRRQKPSDATVLLSLAGAEAGGVNAWHVLEVVCTELPRHPIGVLEGVSVTRAPRLVVKREHAAEQYVGEDTEGPRVDGLCVRLMMLHLRGYVALSISQQPKRGVRGACSSESVPRVHVSGDTSSLLLLVELCTAVVERWDPTSAEVQAHVCVCVCMMCVMCVMCALCECRMHHVQ